MNIGFSCFCWGEGGTHTFQIYIAPDSNSSAVINFDIVLEDCDTSCLSFSTDCSAPFCELEGKLRDGGLVFVQALSGTKGFSLHSNSCSVSVWDIQVPDTCSGERGLCEHRIVFSAVIATTWIPSNMHKLKTVLNCSYD